MRPGQKRSLLSHGHAQIPLQLLLDVAKRRWNLDACGHGKGKPFGLSRTVIGVLPQITTLTPFDGVSSMARNTRGG